MSHTGEGMGRKNLVLDKSFKFGIRIVKLSRYLNGEKEFVLAKQILRSGTAIGALAREAQFAESRADFLHKMCIALKEANETCYWIELLFHSNVIERRFFESIFRDARELLGLLVSITKTAKADRMIA
jgi:four helix bundle protein